VPQRHRHDADAAQREGRRDLVRVELRHTAARFPFAIEDVVEGAAERVPGVPARVARDGAALQVVVAPHFVEAEHVVGVAVREEDRVDAVDAMRQRLLPEVRRRIDQDPGVAGHVDEDRRTEPLVPRIGGQADGTAAADHGNAMRGAGAEKRDASRNGQRR
jgi:hypothetical protein